MLVFVNFAYSIIVLFYDTFVLFEEIWIEYFDHLTHYQMIIENDIWNCEI